jgi:hypothetical protein
LGGTPGTDEFALVAMTGGNNEHGVIGNNLWALLLLALWGKRCVMRRRTMKIEVAGRIRYPDAFVFCFAATPGEATKRGDHHPLSAGRGICPRLGQQPKRMRRARKTDGVLG